MRGYGVAQMPTPRDPFGLAYGSMIQAAMPAPVMPIAPPLAQPIRTPMQQYIGVPRPRQPIGFPVRPLPYTPSAQIPNSPLQPRPDLPSLDAGTITELIKRTESSGNYQALNRERRGNTASGAYQYTDPTWNNYAGYPKAMLAPPAIQDRRFAEDIAARFRKYGGDPFRIIAAHNLPAFADNPATWTQRIKLRNGVVVPPLADYVRKVIRGTQLEGQFDAYLRYHSHNP